MDKKYCKGCYNDVYNHGCGGAKECWSFKDAKVVWRKEVHVDQVPPWKQKAKRTASCFFRPRYVYVKPDKRCWI